MTLRSAVRKSLSAMPWGWILVGWTLYGLYFAVRQISLFQAPDQRLSDVLTVWLLGGYCWAAATPIIVVLARRFRIGGRYRIPIVVLHLASSVLFALAVPAIFVVVLLALFGPPGGPHFSAEIYRNTTTPEFHLHLLKYWVVLGLVQGVAYYRELKDRENRAQLLEAQLTRAHLEALRAQLHPHFLFNTLNSIATLIRRDPDAAEQMLVDLSLLLRAVVDTDSRHEVRLEREIELLRSYLTIEQTRFEDRLTVRIDVDDSLSDALVPKLIFQPIVENAIRHGVARLETGARVDVRAWRSDGRLCLRVADNGRGIDDDGSTRSAPGIGLANTRARVETLYRDTGSVTWANGAEGGFVVTVAIPYHTAGGERDGARDAAEAPRDEQDPGPDR